MRLVVTVFNFQLKREFEQVKILESQFATKFTELN